MNCRTFAIIAVFLATGSGWPVHALAFEQQAPVAAQPPVQPVPAAKKTPGPLDLEAGSDLPSEKKSKTELKLPGIGPIAVPKLNFGLDLMYGQPENDSANLKFTNDPLVGEDELTIMGKVKKRF